MDWRSLWPFRAGLFSPPVKGTPLNNPKCWWISSCRSALVAGVQMSMGGKAKGVVSESAESSPFSWWSLLVGSSQLGLPQSSGPLSTLIWSWKEPRCDKHTNGGTQGKPLDATICIQSANSPWLNVTVMSGQRQAVLRPALWCDMTDAHWDIMPTLPTSLENWRTFQGNVACGLEGS